MQSSLSKSEKIERIKAWLEKTQLDAEVLGDTIKVHESHLSPTVMLRASAKLIQINKKEVEPDNRDNLQYSKFLGIEDYVKEHIEKDAGKLQRKAAGKMQAKKNLSWLSSGFFTPQVRSTIIGNSLAQNVDGINPLEFYDNSHRVTKLGEGGIPSTTGIPDSSRQIDPSSFGFIDPLHTVESEAVGVTGYLTDGVVKGKDNKLYRVMKDKDGKLVWKNHEEILKSVVKVPEY